MDECSQLQIYEVEEASNHGGTCIVRCIRGVARLGQAFTSVAADRDVPADLHLTVTRIERYRNDVEFFDPPHTARVEFSGKSVDSLSRGAVIQGSA